MSQYQETVRNETYSIICHSGLVRIQSCHFREEFKRNHIIKFWNWDKIIISNYSCHGTLLKLKLR